MKKFQKTGTVFRLLMFCIIFLFLFQNVSRLLVFGERGLKIRIRGFYEEPKDSVDIVLLGPSSVYPYYIPGLAYQDYGLATYDFAIPGLKTSMIHYTLMEVEKLQAPDLYIIDIRNSANEDIENDEIRKRRLIDNIELGQAKLEVIRNFVDIEERITYYLGVIKYHDRWKEINKTDWNVLYRKTDVRKGYQPRYKIEPCAELAWLGTTTEKVPLTPENEEALQNLLSYCKDNKINVLFTASPRCQTENRVKRHNYMKDMVAEYGFSFLDANDYYDELKWDFDTDMSDLNHANLSGAIKYTRFLSDYLVKNYDLPDRSEDPRYEEWSQAYYLYLEYCDKMKEKFPDLKLE